MGADHTHSPGTATGKHRWRLFVVLGRVRP